jgi:hypothetical protein
LQKSQLSHEEIVREVIKRYGKMCRRCFHLDSSHLSHHLPHQMQTVYGECFDCACKLYDPLNPLDICELVEGMKETDVGTWYDKLRGVFRRGAV